MKPHRNPGYLAWVRGEGECVFYRDGACEGPIQAHHAFNGATGGGRGMKGSDYACVPICAKHHREVHDKPVTARRRVLMLGDVLGLGLRWLSTIAGDNEIKQRTIKVIIGVIAAKVVDEIAEATDNWTS